MQATLVSAPDPSRYADYMKGLVMKTIAILLLGLTILPVCSCSAEHSVNKQVVESTQGTFITLTPKASTYDLNDVKNGVVQFSSLIKNEGTEAITIAHPSVCFPPDFQSGQTWHQKDIHGKSEILLIITKPNGKTIVLRDGPYFFDPGWIDHLTIPPGETKNFDVGWFFLNARGRWENPKVAATVFLGKGTYKVKIIFRNAFPKARIYKKFKDEPKLENVWTGEMQSKEVAVEIK